MRLPYLALPSVTVPSALVTEADAYDFEADKAWTQVVNIRAPSAYDARPSKTLSPKLRAFLHEVCHRVNPAAHSAPDDSLLFYGNVSRHNDDGSYLNGRRPWFLHVVLRGTGTLRFPYLRDKSRRELSLTPGTVFVMNPMLQHEVRNANDDYGIASLCTSVLLR